MLFNVKEIRNETYARSSFSFSGTRDGCLCPEFSGVGEGLLPGLLHGQVQRLQRLLQDRLFSKLLRRRLQNGLLQVNTCGSNQGLDLAIRALFIGALAVGDS